MLESHYNMFLTQYTDYNIQYYAILIIVLFIDSMALTSFLVTYW